MGCSPHTRRREVALSWSLPRRRAQRGKAATELREAFGVRRIPARCNRRVGDILAPSEETAPGYGALQTLREQGRTRIRRSLRANWPVAVQRRQEARTQTPGRWLLPHVTPVTY